MGAEKKYPSDTADKFLIRMPEGLKQNIRRAADASHRTMNSEIIHQLCAVYCQKTEKADATA